MLAICHGFFAQTKATRAQPEPSRNKTAATRDLRLRRSLIEIDKDKQQPGELRCQHPLNVSNIQLQYFLLV